MILSRREKRRWKNKYWIAACERRVGREAAKLTSDWTAAGRERAIGGRLLARGFAVNSEKKAQPLLSYITVVTMHHEEDWLLLLPRPHLRLVTPLSRFLLFIGCKAHLIYVSILQLRSPGGETARSDSRKVIEKREVLSVHIN